MLQFKKLFAALAATALIGSVLAQTSNVPRAIPPQTPITVTDTTSVDLTASGVATVSAAVIHAPAGGTQTTAAGIGIKVDPTSGAGLSLSTAGLKLTQQPFTEWFVANTATDAGADKTSAISRAGRVNIGTTSQGPATLLNVMGVPNNQVNIGTGSWGLLLGHGDGTNTGAGYHGLNHAAVINVANAPLHLGSGNASDMKIQNTNVGIGLPWATAPNTKLHINSGIAGDTGLRLEQVKQGVTQVPAAITNVAIGVDTTGKVVVAGSIGSADTRAVDSQPQAYAAGSYNEFKQSSSIAGLSAIVPAVGAYIGLQTFRKYGLATDFSGGQVRQEATMDDGRTYWRMSTGATTWGAWKQMLSAGDVNTAVSISGASASSPAAGFHYDAIVSYQGNGNFTTQTITTNIPANTSIMPSIFLRGYTYGTADTVDIQIGLYTYSTPANSIINTVWQSKGTKTPTSIRAGFTAAGMLTLEVTWPTAGGEYFNRYEVSAYNDGNSAHQAAWFQNWSLTSAAFPVTVTNIVTIPQKSNNRFVGVYNAASTAAAIADPALLAGTLYTVTVGGAKQLYIK